MLPFEAPFLHAENVYVVASIILNSACEMLAFTTSCHVGCIPKSGVDKISMFHCNANVLLLLYSSASLSSITSGSNG